MADQVEIQIPRSVVDEGTNFTLTAYFRDYATSAASTPTTVHYKITNKKTTKIETDWTSVTPASNVSITVNSSIDDANNLWERKEIIVQADRGLSTQASNHAYWNVKNLKGI
jgi:hypothetical protein